jgi:hypothetical protein
VVAHPGQGQAGARTSQGNPLWLPIQGKVKPGQGQARARTSQGKDKPGQGQARARTSHCPYKFGLFAQAGIIKVGLLLNREFINHETSTIFGKIIPMADLGG